jgi:xanthine dehydrogenase molybdopterin-binding subunit B
MTVVQNEFTTHPPSNDDDPQREAIKLVAKQILKGELVHKSKIVSKPIMMVGCAVIFCSGYLMAAGPETLPLLSSILPPSLI